ncbi:hypothetical protein GCM10027034_06150 [Ramlibacter solisilvae]
MGGGVSAAQGNAAKAVVRFHDDAATGLGVGGATAKDERSDAGEAKGRLRG